MNKKFWNWIKNEETSETELIFNGPISDSECMGDEITPDLLRDELAKVDGNLTVWLNSPGGDVLSASQIYTMLRNHSGKVTVKIDGLAASAASIVAMSGDKTLMSPTSYLMIHNPLTLALGNRDDMQNAIKMLDEIKEGIINAYTRKSGLSRNKISKMMDEETWMNAEKALELGFIDGILFEEKSTESNKTEDNNSDGVMFSNIKTNDLLIEKMQKVSFENKNSVPINQLEKRLNLLKK